MSAALLESWDTMDDDPSEIARHSNYRETQTSGFVDASLDDRRRTPMFSLRPVEFRASESEIKQLVVCSSRMYIVTKQSALLRVDMQARQAEVIEVGNRRTEDRIRKIFVDPTGHHLLICLAVTPGRTSRGTDDGDVLLVHSSSNKPKPLPKLKGLTITAVGWNKSNTARDDTGDILLGTEDGSIYDTAIKAGNCRGARKLFDLRNPDDIESNSRVSVEGLEVEVFPPHQTLPGTRFFVMAVTHNRYYQFIGGPNFETLFQKAADINITRFQYQEMPGSLDHTQLVFYSKYCTRAQKFAWLSGSGICSGSLIFGSQDTNGSVINDFQQTPYPRDVTAHPPQSIGLTEFHYLLLYRDRILALNSLSNEQVWDDHEFFLHGRDVSEPVGIAMDASRNVYYVHTQSRVFEVVVTDENRNVWQQYLDRGDFEMALEHCSDPAQRDKVLIAKADHYFKQGAYELSGQIYASTTRSFEEVTLKFIQNNERDALKLFLLKKLEGLDASKPPSRVASAAAPPPSSSSSSSASTSASSQGDLRGHRDATQLAVICTWLTEIFLNQINTSKGELQDSRTVEFRKFLKQYKSYLHTATTYQLIASHGRVAEMLYYARKIKDFTRVINHHIFDRDYPKALAVLKGQNSADLFYQFSPVLMRHDPYHTVEAWINSTVRLEPRKLIPSLIRYHTSHNPPGVTQNQAIRYLRHCVANGCRDASIHNYLISLYVRQSDDTDLLRFLSPPNGEVLYDMKYALRLCAEARKTAACVYIYSAMALYEQAVELALNVDVNLAKANAEKAEDDPALRKKLWLQIACYVLTKNKDIKTAISLVNECDCLNIEDLLPHFPDFVLIDDFKEEICASLSAYNNKISELKADMDEATRNAEQIRQDIKQLHNRYGFVGANQKCDLCCSLVVSRPFYFFACQHVFHCDCLVKEVSKSWNRVKRQQLDEKQTLMGQLLTQLEIRKRGGPGSGGGPTGTSRKDAGGHEDVTRAIAHLQTEIDDMVGEECLFCGDIMIRSIDNPFISPTEDIAVLKSWEL